MRAVLRLAAVHYADTHRISDSRVILGVSDYSYFAVRFAAVSSAASALSDSA
jgi:hypothetical protein